LRKSLLRAVSCTATCRKPFPSLNEAARDFLRLFSDQDFKGDLTLAAQMAGLKMLRSSGVTLGG
jgi:hypothetical protein